VIRRSAPVLLGTISAAAASMAVAQDADVSVKDLSGGERAYIQTVLPFADCLVAHDAKEIPKFIEDPDQSRKIGRNFKKLYPECPSPKSSGEDATFLLQGAVLEALIRRDFGNVTAPADFADVPPLIYVKATDNRYLREDLALLMEPYDCTARRAPAKVQAIFRTEPLSAAEASAFAALNEDLVACHPKGESWQLRTYFARRFLAEAFYTLMKIDQRKKASVH
jgi:hypothetical protein